MEFKFGKNVLLMGAGFTHNFGTPLAKEMWSEIFNHKSIQSQQRIWNLMLQEFDYESVYYTVTEKRIYAHFFHRMNMSQIARIEGVNPNSVKGSIKRGLKRMEKFLKIL